jgi:aspartate/methionine/tyrosine aminotransferase
VLNGQPPRGAFYAFLRINPEWRRDAAAGSLSWSLAEHLIKAGRIGCVPGADFGSKGEGYIRFCFARSREELRGALESMGNVFGVSGARAAAS